MTSLPIPLGWREPRVEVVHPSGSDIGKPWSEDEQSLLRAFHTFADAASALEQSYAALQAEVDRLRRELALSNSDLARSAEENRRMRAHLDQILDRLPCGVLVVASDGQISRANPEALRLMNNSGGVSSLSQLDPKIRELLEWSRGDCKPECKVQSSDGSIRWIGAQRAELERECGAIVILQDLTERKCWEEAQARLRQDQALAEVSALLAHEIRNPLGSLELFAGLLAESEMEGECGQWVEHIQAGLRTLAATVNNVLQFHSTPEIERSPVDMGDLVEWARHFFEPLARQSQITLSLQNCVAGVSFPADRHRLEQVLLNLVLNSIRAMPNGGWIELGGRRVLAGGIELDVSDTGPGISSADLPHIFEPGFTRRSGSPGLGLAVCRKIVEQHGGTIRAANRPTHGAIFTLTFPGLCDSPDEVRS
ncbi:MAG: ATP-binding protein [Candidatus Sulfotelmatobacter sp.]